MYYVVYILLVNFAQENLVTLSKIIQKTVAVVGFSAILAGCSQVQFISQSAKSLGGLIGTNDYGEYGPRYKVGNPYSIKGKRYIPSENYSYKQTGIASWYGPNFHGKSTANGGTFDMHTISAAHRTLPVPSVVRVTNLENGRQLKIVINDRGPYAHDRIIDLSRRSAELLGVLKKGTALVRVEIIADESRSLKKYMQTNGRYGRLPSSSLKSRYTNLNNKRLNPNNYKQVSSAAPVGGVSRVTSKKSTPILKSPNQLVKTTRPIAKPRPATPLRQGTFVQAGLFSNKGNAVKTVRALKKHGIVRMDVIKNSAGKKFYRVRVGPIKTAENADKILASVRRSGFKDATSIFIKQ